MDQSTRCTNCGATRYGEYCSACGQNSRNYLRAAHRIVGELIGETFEFDARVFRSLRYLILAPGFLSSEFSAGRRAHYVSPVRLYLAVSVMFFFLVSVTPTGDPGLTGPDIVVEFPETSSHDADTAADADGFEATLMAKARILAANPKEAYRNFIDNLPLMMFLLMPFFALLLKIVYPRRYYSEHFVFALHLHAFLYLVLTVLLLVPNPAAAGDGTASANSGWRILERALLLGCVAYGTVALKNFYRQSFTRTIAKALLLSSGYFALLFIGLALTIGYTILRY